MMGLKAIRKEHSLMKHFLGGSFSSKTTIKDVSGFDVDMHFLVMLIHFVLGRGAFGRCLL